MNCKDFQQRLEASVDQRQLVDATGLCEHALCCDRCRAEWDEYLVLEAAIADWRSGSLDVDLTDRVLRDFRAEHAKAASAKASEMDLLVDAARVTVERIPNQPVDRGLWPALVTVVLALSLAMAVLVTRGRRAGNEVAQPDQVTLPAPTEEFADLSDIVEDAKSAWLGLAQTTAQRARDLRVFVPSLRSSDSETPLQPMDSDMPDDMTDGLAPVPTEVRRAFEFLIKAAEFEESQTT